MRAGMKKAIFLLLIIVCVFVATNYRTIIKTTNIYEGSIGLRGCKWNDTPAQVIKTIKQNIEYAGDVDGYVLYETTTAVKIGAIEKAWITFYFNKQSAELKMIDYSFNEKHYNTAQTLLQLKYNSNKNPILKPRGSETHLFKADIYAHITIVPYGEDYRTWDITW